MIKNAHTPGPWVIESENSNDIVSDVYDVEICTIQPVDIGGKKMWDYGDITKANANLIAAAPDLLEALVKFREAFVIAAGDKSPFCKFALEPVDAAIDRARGEAC